MIEILAYALLAGVGLALIAGPLGAFVIWRRMAYFGDTLAHSALMGVALGLMLEVNLYLAIAATSLLIALLLTLLEQYTHLANDSLLGILSHSSLAVGLVAVSLFSEQGIDLFGFLFGDILTVDLEDLAVIYTVTSVGLLLLVRFWKTLLLVAIDAELASAEGQPLGKLRLLLVLIIAMVVAIAIKVVGALLITALLIVPAATAQRISRSPEAMAIISSVLGILAVIGGLSLSYAFNTPAGPAIVLTATLFFCISLTCQTRRSTS